MLDRVVMTSSLACASPVSGERSGARMMFEMLAHASHVRVSE
jgi:hypothetical protein